MLKRILSLCVVTFLIVPLFALVNAQGTITGTVTDSETDEPLPGATVQIPELNLGTNVDADGSFTLSEVAAGTHQLTVTFVGYLEHYLEVTVSDGEELIVEIELESDVLGLDQIVVTGLGIRQERGRTQTSVGRVDAAEITARAEVGSVSQLISGNVAGVSAQASSGNIGSGIRFNVRGGGGLGGDGQPIIYVDGVRIDNQEIGGFGAGGQGVSALAELNPNEIQNIDIIRGPAGAAIYGTEGANGVVLIETKSGQYFDEPTMNFQYRGTYGFSDQGNREYDDDLYQTADDANAIFREGALRSHNFSVSGGADAYRYFGSVENRQEEGIIPRTEGDRTNMRANFEVYPTEDVSIRANAGFTTNTMERPDNDNNVQGYLGNTLLLPVSYLYTDSLAINEMEDIQRVNRFTGSIRANWSPFENFDISATGGFDSSTRRQDRNLPPGFVYAGIEDRGEHNIYSRINNQANFDVQAQYTYRITDQLQGTTLLGGQFTDITRRVNWSTAEGFGSRQLRNASAAVNFVDQDETLLNTRRGGIFAQHEFAFSDTYFLTGMLRRDVATALGEGVSDVWYPSGSASVMLSNFNFIPDSFSQLRARIAYGETGELPEFDDARPLRVEGIAAATGSGAVIGSVGDPNIVPERVREFEAGVDLTFLQDYTLDATYWYNWADDSIIESQLASSTGFGWQTLPRNVGSIESQGFEATLGLTPVLTETARFDVDLTYSYQTSEVKDLGDDVETIFGGFNINVLTPGLPRQAFYVPEVIGPSFNEAGEYVGPETGDRIEVGQPIPEHTGGIRLNATMLQNLNIGVFAEYATGHQMYNSTASFAALTGNHVPRNDASERLEEAAPGTDEYEQAAEDLAFTNGNLDANFVEDADWVKLREVTISYNLSDILNRMGATQVSNLQIGFAARNLFTFTKYDNPDPEINFDGSRGLIRGQDFLTLQTPRTLTANVTLGF